MRRAPGKAALRARAWRLLAAGACLVLAACAGVVVHEVRSEYSHIRVVDFGSQRALVFVGDADIDVVETLIDLREPHRLQHAYAQTAMAGLLYVPDAQSVLLVGLGGGAIVRFLNHHFPALRLDVVEIDAEVVRVAHEFFGARETPGTRFHVADGREFVARRTARYDLILVDAHLHPEVRTDSTGHPLSLKGEPFYRQVRERLRPGAVAMFNVIDGRDAAAHVAGLRAAFADAHVYRPAGSGNVIVFVAARGRLPAAEALRERAQALDRRGNFGFSFEQVLRGRERAR